MCTCYRIFHLFILPISLNWKWVSCKQFIMWSYFFLSHSANLCLLIVYIDCLYLRYLLIGVTYLLLYYLFTICFLAFFSLYFSVLALLKITWIIWVIFWTQSWFSYSILSLYLFILFVVVGWAFIIYIHELYQSTHVNVLPKFE